MNYLIDVSNTKPTHQSKVAPDSAQVWQITSVLEFEGMKVTFEGDFRHPNDKKLHVWRSTAQALMRERVREAAEKIVEMTSSTDAAK